MTGNTRQQAHHLIDRMPRPSAPACFKFGGDRRPVILLCVTPRLTKNKNQSRTNSPPKLATGSRRTVVRALLTPNDATTWTGVIKIECTERL